MSKKRPPLYERLKAALEQGVAALEQGTAKVTQVHAPEAAPKLSAIQIRGIRERLGLPQVSFAATLNVSAKTVQAWEQGLRKPDGAALRLLQIVAEHPAVMDAVPAMKYSRTVTNEGTPEQRALYATKRRKKVA